MSSRSRKGCTAGRIVVGCINRKGAEAQRFGDTGQFGNAEGDESASPEDRREVGRGTAKAQRRKDWEWVACDCGEKTA